MLEVTDAVLSCHNASIALVDFREERRIADHASACVYFSQWGTHNRHWRIKTEQRRSTDRTNGIGQSL